MFFYKITFLYVFFIIVFVSCTPSREGNYNFGYECQVSEECREGYDDCMYSDRGYQDYGRRDYDYSGRRDYDYSGRRDYGYSGRQDYGYSGRQDYGYSGRQDYGYSGSRNMHCVAGVCGGGIAICIDIERICDDVCGYDSWNRNTCIVGESYSTPILCE